MISVSRGSFYLCLAAAAALAFEHCNRGPILWSFDTGSREVSRCEGPAVGLDGTIYAGGVDRGGKEPRAALYVISPSGKLEDKVVGGPARYGRMANLSVAVGPSGTVYAIDDWDGRYMIRPGAAGVFQSDAGVGSVARFGFHGPLAIESDDTVYAVGFGEVYSLDFDPAGDSYRWKAGVPAGTDAMGMANEPDLFGPTVVRRGTVYFTTYAGKLYAAENGKAVFKSAPPLQAVCGLLVTDRFLYGASENERVVALSHEGELQWELKTDHEVGGKPVLGPDGSIFVVGGALMKLSSAGEIEWSAAETLPFTAGPIVHRDTLLVVDGAGTVYAIDFEGKTRWQVKVGPKPGPPSVAPSGTIYIKAADGRVYAIAPPENTER